MLGKNQKKKKQLNSYIIYTSLTAQMFAIIAGGVFFGDFLDSKAHYETPIYTIFFSLASIFFSGVFIIKKAKKLK